MDRERDREDVAPGDVLAAPSWSAPLEPGELLALAGERVRSEHSRRAYRDGFKALAAFLGAADEGRLWRPCSGREAGELRLWACATARRCWRRDWHRRRSTCACRRFGAPCAWRGCRGPSIGISSCRSCGATGRYGRRGGRRWRTSGASWRPRAPRRTKTRRPGTGRSCGSSTTSGCAARRSWTFELGDVDLRALTLAVVRKGGARVLLELPAPTAAAIVAWVARRGTRPGPLFVELTRRGERRRLAAGGLYFVVRRLGEELGVRVRPHGLRHTSITSVLTVAANRGLPLPEVLAATGHARASIAGAAEPGGKFGRPIAEGRGGPLVRPARSTGRRPGEHASRRTACRFPESWRPRTFHWQLTIVPLGFAALKDALGCLEADCRSSTCSYRNRSFRRTLRNQGGKC